MWKTSSVFGPNSFQVVPYETAGECGQYRSFLAVVHERADFSSDVTFIHISSTRNPQLIHTAPEPSGAQVKELLSSATFCRNSASLFMSSSTFAIE
jgi:hypothetical protein